MSSLVRRLIEVDLPIKRISQHARPEKTTVHGNISTLHIWWARRPHAACRAVLCTSLWPDPADLNCPDLFRKEAAEYLVRFARLAVAEKKIAGGCSPDIWPKWIRLSKDESAATSIAANAEVLRNLLFDFVVDFSKWENQAIAAYLETARSITSSAHHALTGESTAPLVFDPFAGGGTIPLEATRIGADAFASDLNPIATVLNKVALEFIHRSPQTLKASVAHWSEWIKARVSSEICPLYPLDQSGGLPLVYLWARTVFCEGPSCGFKIPLIRTLDLGGGQSLRLIPNYSTKLFDVKVESGVGRGASATVRGGSVTCPACKEGYTTSAISVKVQLSARNGGSKDAQLLAVLVDDGKLRRFRSPEQCDWDAVERTNDIDQSAIPDVQINPIRPHKNTRGLSAVTRIGMNRFSDLYTNRQLSALDSFSRAISAAIEQAGPDPEARRAITILGLCFGRLLQQNSSCARWRNKAYAVAGSFGKQALQVVWDFAEIAPLAAAAGSWDSAVEWVQKIIDLNQNLTGEATVTQAPAQECPLPFDSADLLFTDPPYFAAIPYADLANFFYVWERRFFVDLYPDLFEGKVIDQTRETIVTNANVGPDGCIKDEHFFRKEMTIALQRARDIVKPGGVGVVVFADTRTASWEAILGAIIDSGWMITASWPIDTEHQNRTQAHGAASLQSSIHLVCRPRETTRESGQGQIVGDWRDVLAELPKRMHEWMPRLAQEGIVGADAIFACLGPALEIFSCYQRVEKASGELVVLNEYLEQVWAAVSKEAITMVFKGADANGFEEDARLTAMWLWTISAGVSSQGDNTAEDLEEDEEQESGDKKPNGFVLEFDAARKIAQGLGAHLESLASLIEVKGEIARLLPVAERTRKLFGKDEAGSPSTNRKRKSPQMELGFVAELREAEEAGSWGAKGAPALGATVLDRVHQSMILFAAGRSDALRRFLVDEGVGKDGKFWRLAQVLSYLYPKSSDEKRWVDGLFARKKGLGF